ncbi:hypothetical protein [Hymenobacter tibetensis]|nr:hypothetical protein [Hymenobacter tibetensis]
MPAFAAPTFCFISPVAASALGEAAGLRAALHHEHGHHSSF